MRRELNIINGYVSIGLDWITGQSRTVPRAANNQEFDYIYHLSNTGEYKMAEKKTYIAIDLKSFYASVECRERGLDPLSTNLVVADRSRTEKTICLAVSPALKAWGLPGRPRLYEVVQKVKEINARRRMSAPGRKLSGSSYLDAELKGDPSKELDYIIAPPRMAFYLDYSTRVYEVYLKYFAPEDIVVYSIDEVFIDATSYLKTYGKTAHELTMHVVQDVVKTTGITATAGIGTNLFLCKIAMDIVAKRMPPDRDGVRIAELDEMSYRRELWSHRPLTDFWRVGKGYAKKLEANGMYTMGDIARCSLGGPGEHYNEELLYKLFGINAELLIDHAWGWEPCEIKDIKAYKPSTKSLSSGQVLQEPYTAEKARLVVKEMTDALVLDIVDKRLVTDQIVLTIGYDIENLKDPERRRKYNGDITTDAYGRQIPKHAHGTESFKNKTSSTGLIMEAMMRLFDRIIDTNLLVRRITISVNRLTDENAAGKEEFQQLNLFDQLEETDTQHKTDKAMLEKERKMQETMLHIKKKYGKNAILKGTSFEQGATARDRNQQIGGHKA